MRPVLDQFTAETGIEVVYKQNTVKEYRQRLVTDVSAGGGPDVFRFHNTWTPTLIEGLAPIPRSSVTTIGLETDFYPVVTKDVRRGTEFYGVPLMMDGLALYYNKAMFQTAGKTPPVTWNELRETAIDLTIRNNQRIERGGIALGTTNNVDHFSDILGLMILQNGGNPADPESSLVQTAAAFYSLFSTTDKVWDGTFPTSTYAFATEKVAMIIAPSWRAHEISQINPNLDFATTQLPQLPLEPGQSPVTWASYWVDGVNANSNAQSAAFTLLEYLSRPAVLQNIYARAASERLFGPVYPRVSMASLVQNDPYVGAYVAQAPYSLSWPMASSTMDQGLNDRIIKYYEDFLNAGVSAQSATQAKQGVAQILSQFGVSASR